MAVANVSQVRSVLDGEQFVSLTTYRKNGNDVSTPVWFAQDVDKIYVVTMRGSGKVKRIRNNGHVKLAPSNARGIVHGDTINGMATTHNPDSPTGQMAHKALSKKYGFMLQMFRFMWWIRRAESVFIEITPQ